MLAEFKKLRIAVALTGFTANGDPEFAVVVLTHDSPAAGIAARAFLTMTTGLRKVAEVAKVPVFQYRTPNIQYDNNGLPTIKSDDKLSDGPHEQTFAYTPDLFVMGTNKTAIGHALTRFMGEDQDKTLSATPLFKDAAKSHRKTGIFYYVNYPEFTAKFTAANRTRGEERGIEDLLRPLAGGGEFDPLAWFNLTVNAKAVKSVAGNLRFRDGGLSATMAISIDAAQKSPLLGILSGPDVQLQTLHHVRGPVTFAVGVTFPVENRAAAVIGFLDAVAKAGGELGRLPGEAIREWEQKYKVAVSQALLGKTRAATIFLPKNQELPKGAKSLPVFVLHTDDAAAAEAWEGFFPRMIADLAGAAKLSVPSTETIAGVKVYSLPGTGLRWNAPVHYARRGAVFAMGLDRNMVAAAVTADAAASVAGGEKAVSPPAAGVAAFGVVSVGDLFLGLLEGRKPTGPVVPAEEQPLFLPNGNRAPESFIEDLKKSQKVFVESIAKLPLATLTAKRDGNQLLFELFQPKVQGGLKAVIDAGANWLDKAGSLLGLNRQGRFYSEFGGRW
jgi:hypothetical protein